LNKCIWGDSFEEIKKIESNSVKLIIADPDYVYPKTQYRPNARVSLNSWGSFSSVTKSFRELINECDRILRDDGFVIFFCDSLMCAVLYPIFYEKFYYVKELTWDKKKIGMGGFWRSQTEKLLFASTKPISQKSGDGDILQFSPIPSNDRLHYYEKPEALITKLITKCTSKNDLVYDPFAGSGIVPLVCKKLDRNCISYEIDEKQYSKIKKRLDNSQANFQITLHSKSFGGKNHE